MARLKEIEDYAGLVAKLAVAEHTIYELESRIDDLVDTSQNLIMQAIMAGVLKYWTDDAQIAIDLAIKNK